jgi:hypothetical protein
MSLSLHKALRSCKCKKQNNTEVSESIIKSEEIYVNTAAP